MSTDISFAKLTIEARTEVIKEAMESTLWSLEKSEKEIEFLRARLQEQKDALGHGRWLPWIRETFGDDNATIRKIQRFLQKPNATLLTYLDCEPLSNAEQLVPREARKPGRVKVVEPPAEHIVDANEKVDDSTDDDPTPDPPTIRKTAAGSRKVPESEKPKTRPVQAELLPEDPPLSPKQWPDVSLEDLVEGVICRMEHDKQRKAAAKTLRKLADKLDPPTKFVPPTVEEVEEYCRARNNGIDAEAFVATGRANGWLLSNGNKMKDWQGAIITWEKNQKRFEQANNGKGTGNGHSKQSLADNIAAKAARLKDIFG